MDEMHEFLSKTVHINIEIKSIVQYTTDNVK